MLLFHLRGFIFGTNLSTTLQAWLAVWYCSCRTFILIGAFTAGICDLITIFIWVVSGNCFSKFWNELSFGLLFHIVFSPRINDNSFQLIFFSSCLFSPPYVGSTNSLLEFMYSLTYIFRGWLWILKCQWIFISNIYFQPHLKTHLHLKLCGGATSNILRWKWLVSDSIPMMGRTSEYLLAWCDLMLLKMFSTYLSECAIVVKDFKKWIHQYYKNA